MISVKNLHFNYSTKKVLKGISFDIKEGSIVALVGANGAGKTTLMRCLAALEEPLEGTISINGLSTYEQPREVHCNIGFLPDFFGVYDDLTIKQNLLLVANNQDINNDLIEEKVLLSAQRVQLENILDEKVKNLSRGLRQRLAIAQTIIHKPKFLILDEPTAGLDPKARVKLSELFLSLQKEGMTLLVSSHILTELEDYCTDMLIIKNGELIEYKKKIKKNSNNFHKIEISFKLGEDKTSFEKINTNLQQDSRVKNLQIEEDKIIFLFNANKKEISIYLKELVANYDGIYSFSVKKDSLYDIYMKSIEL